MLDCGTALDGVMVAYRTYGTLNTAKSNAILICHALTGDQHVASTNPVTGKPGWWHRVIGPARQILSLADDISWAARACSSLTV